MNCSEYLELIKQKTSKVEQVSWEENADLCMVFVEFRKLDIIPVNLYNIANVYGNSDTSLVILHSKVNKELITETVKDWKGVRLIQLTQNESSIDEYNKFFTSVGFWRLFEKHKFVLINQWDSYLFKKIPQKFFNYDYVGPPCDHFYGIKDGKVFTLPNKYQYTIDPHENIFTILCGGFSLRNVEKSKLLCERKHFNNEPEDVYFSMSFLSKPSIHESLEFGIGAYIGYRIDNSVGCHKIWESSNKEYILNLFNNVKSS
tara:strand:+ start:576 stop:1352 length:777 start_codon:yes stop_codon:yes gene_type:complete